jgi:protein CpxP
MRNNFAKAIVVLSLAAAAPLAIAQTQAPSVDRPEGRPGAQHERRPFSLPGERIEARLAYDKTALKITTAQESQWNAYADVLRKQAREMDQRIEAWRSQGGKMQRDHRPTAIERLQREQEFLTAASQRLDELLAAAKPLYAALSPEQQQIADQILASRHGGMHAGSGWHGKGMGAGPRRG